MDWVYWHWLVLGLGLIVIEIFLPSFTVLWFGLGAVVVGILLWIFPALGIGLQVLVWTVTSILFAVAWFRYFKPKMIDKTVAGLSREGAVGRVGQVVKAPFQGGRGRVRFTMPVLGEDEWEFIAKQEGINEGDRVVVTEFSGNALIVDKQN